MKCLTLMVMSTTRNPATAVQRSAFLLTYALSFVYPIYARYTALETGVELVNINKFFCGVNC